VDEVSANGNLHAAAPVVLYTRAHCRACDQVKQYLSSAGVTYVSRDVDVDEGAYDELVARGWRFVPMTFIGHRAIKGFDAKALHDAIAEM
jgi:glutaredoxin